MRGGVVESSLHENISVQSDMGYFEGLTSGCFKITPDGRRLFFPWGILGSGYAIASEEGYGRLRQQVKSYLISGMVLIIGSLLFGGYALEIATAAFLIALYLAWMCYLLPRLKHSGEKLSLQESMTSRAHAHGAVVLWLLEIAALAFVGSGIFVLIVAPGLWFIALASIVFFGLSAAMTARMLVLRRRTADVQR